jgi:hypothetical protein
VAAVQGRSLTPIDKIMNIITIVIIIIIIIIML